MTFLEKYTKNNKNSDLFLNALDCISKDGKEKILEFDNSTWKIKIKKEDEYINIYFDSNNFPCLQFVDTNIKGSTLQEVAINYSNFDNLLNIIDNIGLESTFEELYRNEFKKILNREKFLKTLDEVDKSGKETKINDYLIKKDENGSILVVKDNEKILIFDEDKHLLTPNNINKIIKSI